MDFEKQIFNIDGYETALYKALSADAPLIVYNSFEGMGDDIYRQVRIEGLDFNFLVIKVKNWGDDMSPWYCPPVMPKMDPSGGKGAAFMALMLNSIIPAALERIDGKPSFMGLVGYSMSGMFGLYCMCHTDIFKRVACVSGALWYPDFADYLENHNLKGAPDKIYISLGDKEHKTGNTFLKEVKTATERICETLKAKGYAVTFESNPGNHFKDADKRLATGIKDILK